MPHIPKTVLITGATGDFGIAFAKKFAAAGSNLILHGRNQEKLDLLKESFPDAKTLCFDIGDHNAITDALKNIDAPDLLINNAGGAIGQEPAYDAKLEDWLNMVNINVTGLITTTNMILPKMVARQSGHIINIGSVAGNYAYAGGHVYNGCKAFVRFFSGALRSDLIDKNIRITNIEPGMVETQFSLVRFKGDKDKADAVYAGADALQADDIAESVFWVASQPPHVNISRLEVMSTTQATGSLAVHRKTA
ncbi:MAG: SDR family NAD(P)-dependent oxidoreductase [Alphaproteobacteria bacterium]